MVRELVAVAQEYLKPVMAEDVDTLVLGCTHYPVLTALIQHVVGDDVTLVSSAEETAKDVLNADNRRPAASRRSSCTGARVPRDR